MRLHLLGAMGLAAVAAAAACGSSSGGDNVVSYGGASGASGSGAGTGPAGGTNSGGLGAIGGNGGTINTTGGGSGSGPGPDACAGDFFDAQQKPLDMFIMYDQSGSMGRNGRWDAVKSAMIAFLEAPESSGIGVGIAYFPLTPPPCTMQSDTCLCIIPGVLCIPLGGGSCAATDYARPDVEIQPLPGVAQAIVGSLNNHQPGGGTPTVPALDGAVQYATQWATSHPDHKTIVVLATDGQPEGCNSDIPGVANIAAAAFAANPSVQTYVIGVGDVGNLNAIAQAGGTTQAFLVSDQNANQAFLDAMNQIRGQSLACEYSIPLPQGQQPNFGQVNVYHTPQGGGEGVIYRVPDASACDPTNGGWFYDNPTAPTRIISCPQSCEKLKAGGAVRISVGCASITPPA